MPREITTTVYKYSELSDKAKAAARDEWREAMTNDVYDQSCKMMQEDAERIGLKLGQLGPSPVDNDGEFIGSAFDTMNKIREEHGPECDTFKAAKTYEDAVDALPDFASAGEEMRNAESLDVLEGEFLVDLLECYRKMRDREDEYQLSDEAVAESIIANEYEYTENGKQI